MKRVEIFSGNWTEIDVMKSSHKYFVFGDNFQRWGKGGQAIIRDLKNTIGIRTKKKPDNFSTSFLTDDEYNTNSKLILEDILVIKEKNLLDEDIVVSKNGYGTGLAKMSERSPLTFNYLNDSLKNLLHFDNTLGVHYYRLPSGNEIASGDYVSLTDILQPNNNSLFLESCLKSDIYNVYDQILNQKKISVTFNKCYKSNDIINFYYPGKSLYLVCKVLHNSISVDNVDKKLLSSFEGFQFDFVKDYSNDNFVTFIEFICTLDDKGNMVYNEDYFSNESVKVPLVEEKKEDVVNINLEKKIDELNKKLDLIWDYLTKKL